jgi:hypothetical protein
MARVKWLADRETELLPAPYFHVVFTLPRQIGGLALQNAREIYRLPAATGLADHIDVAFVLEHAAEAAANQAVVVN